MLKKLKKNEIAIGWDVGGWSGKNHGYCVLMSDGSEIKLLMATKLNIYQIKESIEEIIDQYQENYTITIGIDAPLQFPQLFKEILAQKPSNIFDTVQNSQKENPIAWRMTDLYIKKHFKKTPLSASFSFLTSNATVAISLIGELKAKYEQFTVLPFDAAGEIRAIETYPGLLKSIVIKKDPIFHDFQAILEDKKFKGIEGFDYYFQEAKEKTDIADAVICAIYAFGLNGQIPSIPNLNKEIPPNLLSVAKKEGWIYYPDIL